LSGRPRLEGRKRAQTRKLKLKLSRSWWAVVLNDLAVVRRLFVQIIVCVSEVGGCTRWQ
jgi:hypothetical protein